MCAGTHTHTQKLLETIFKYVCQDMTDGRCSLPSQTQIFRTLQWQLHCKDRCVSTIDWGEYLLQENPFTEPMELRSISVCLVHSWLWLAAWLSPLTAAAVVPLRCQKAKIVCWDAIPSTFLRFSFFYMAPHKSSLTMKVKSWPGVTEFWVRWQCRWSSFMPI